MENTRCINIKNNFNLRNSAWSLRNTRENKRRKRIHDERRNRVNTVCRRSPRFGGKNVLAVGRSDAGIAMEQSGEIVRLFFMLGTPKTKPGDYLAVVSALCKVLRDASTREALLAAATPEEFIDVIRAAEDKLTAPAPSTARA